nr:MAG TPA: hypothetical protein [Bacteriophage sp.]
MTPSTKKYRKMRNICGFFSTLCTIGLIIYFIVIAMMAATPVQKVSIGFIASLSCLSSCSSPASWMKYYSLQCINMQETNIQLTRR